MQKGVTIYLTTLWALLQCMVLEIVTVWLQMFVGVKG